MGENGTNLEARIASRRKWTELGGAVVKDVQPPLLAMHRIQQLISNSPGSRDGEVAQYCPNSRVGSKEGNISAQTPPRSSGCDL